MSPRSSLDRESASRVCSQGIPSPKQSVKPSRQWLRMARSFGLDIRLRLFRENRKQANRKARKSLMRSDMQDHSAKAHPLNGKVLLLCLDKSTRQRHLKHDSLK